MMPATYTSTISSQGQLTIPVDIRKHLGVVEGNMVVWKVKKDSQGTHQVIVQAGTSHALKRLRGVAKDFYRKHGGGDHVLKEEREAWDR